jgi:hypothetical protein
VTTRTLNYTRRSRIELEWFNVRTVRIGEDLKIQLLSFDHSQLPHLPPSATVVLNCYLGRLGQIRVECGTVSSLLTNIEQSFWIGDHDSIRLSLLVRDVDSTSSGKILARSAEVPRFVGGGTKSLLVVKPEHLGSQVWRLQIDEERGPELLVNDRIRRSKELVCSNEFSALVIPEIFRQISDWVLLNYSQFEEPGSIGYHWRQMVDALGVELEGEDLSESSRRELLAQDLELAFAGRHRSLEILAYDEQEGLDD